MTSQGCSPAPRRAKRVFLALLGSLILPAAFLIPDRPSWSQAQQQPPPAQQKQQQEPYKIRSEVNMVMVPTTVRKLGGGFVKGLPKEAFRITEEGEEQEIVTFSQEAVPTRIAIVLDISGSVRSEWGTIKFATRKFAEGLKPEDQFSLVTFNTETRLKMDWGNKTDRLEEVLSSIYCKDNTNLWDTVWVVAEDVFNGIREKKAMIIMSDGLDNNSYVAYKDALAAAVRSEAVVYVVSKTEAVRQTLIDDLAKQGYYAGIPEQEFAQADLALRKLAFETGGRVLYPNSFGQLGNAYAEVDEELRNQYSVGYISSNTAKDGGYRRIQVSVNSPGAQVAARQGYYAPGNLPPGKK
jgi:Ca-activated chloride channel family protein